MADSENYDVEATVATLTPSDSSDTYSSILISYNGNRSDSSDTYSSILISYNGNRSSKEKPNILRYLVTLFYSTQVKNYTHEDGAKCGVMSHKFCVGITCI